jgi:putative nucleotidyltransferase with HDIG domain
MLMLVLSGVHTGRSDGGAISILEVLILIAPLPVILYVTFRHALGRAADQITQLGRMNKVYVGAIEALAQAIDAKDQVTHDHIRRVQHNAVRLARALHVDEDMEIQAIKAAALLHDVGKLGVPEHILNKPGRLSASEFEIMKRHAPIGADILSMIGFPYPVVPIVRHHHESWDGSGYPDGLTGDRIPIGARILAVVDCFDALTSDRPYRRRLDDQEALQILADRRGTMYDPGVVDAFFALHKADTGQALIAPEAQPDPVFPPAAPTHAGAPAGATDLPDLDVFFEIGRSLRRDAPASELGATLWKHLHEQIPAAAFVLFAYEEESDSLTPAYLAGDVSVPRHARIALGDRLSGWVAASRQSIVNSDARLDLDVAAREDTLLRSALAVPIDAGPHVSGVLTFYSRQPDGFSDIHLRLARAAARVAARHDAAPAASQPAA